MKKSNLLKFLIIMKNDNMKTILILGAIVVFFLAMAYVNIRASVRDSIRVQVTEECRFWNGEEYVCV